MKQRVVVICPGRGTYNKEELGYLQRYHADKQDFIEQIDGFRTARQQVAISQLDGASQYNLKQHSAGENASALIYACAYADFLDINRDNFELVAVTGNSMGWYIALACGGAVEPSHAIDLINTMGSMMQKGVIGGQALYPVVDDQWHHDPTRQLQVEQAIAAIHGQDDCLLYNSIRLGGYRVLGGNDKGLAAFADSVPHLNDQFPMRLYNHAAFHTPMLSGISAQAKQLLPESYFRAPQLPLIDGRGNSWQPYSTHTGALWDYTLGHQVQECYDFTAAIEVAIKEYAPDKLIITGPGATLGGAVAQILIENRWQGLSSKDEFVARQKTDPVILSMGIDEQRKLAV